MRTLLLASACLTILPLAATSASAALVQDATGDYLPGFTGARLADLDVTSFSVDYSQATAEYLLGATFAGAIQPGTAGFYVIGVNTGRGAIAPFASIGQGNVTFDQAIVLNKDGTGSIGAVTLDPSRITITGNILTARIAGSLLPSTGATALGYGFNLWPRVGFGNNAQISDFSPENALLTAAVPEPAGWAMMLTGFFLVGGVTRRRTGRARIAFA